jgi:hypothetical protein
MTSMAKDQLPDYHFLMITPNLGAEWLFEAARAYWEHFQPTVISDFELLGLLPADSTISVTAVTRRDRVAQLGVELAQTAPNALFDPIVFDFFEDTRLELDRRAQTNQPFGVPLATPTPGPTPPPVYPTVGAVVTGAPGFVTQTPTPEQPPTEVLPPQTPLYPTPGAVTGSNGS